MKTYEKYLTEMFSARVAIRNKLQDINKTLKDHANGFSFSPAYKKNLKEAAKYVRLAIKEIPKKQR